MYFPRAEDVSAPVPVRHHAREPGARTETILLIEDERRLRAALAAVLQRWGYRVLEAADDEAALLACRDENTKIDLFFPTSCSRGRRVRSSSTSSARFILRRKSS